MSAIWVAQTGIRGEQLTLEEILKQDAFTNDITGFLDLNTVGSTLDISTLSSVRKRYNVSTFFA